MNQKGQLSFLLFFQFMAILLLVGVGVYAFNPVIEAIWDLNVDVPNYSIARQIVDLWPLLLVLMAIAGYTILNQPTRP